MNVFDFTVPALDGTPTPLAGFRGHLLLIVNVASRCGYTPQYAGLERLHRAYRDQRFAVLGFPCNQFGGQEPGSADEIRDFCATAYDVTFPLFAKIDVTGAAAHPLFRHLSAARKGWLGTAAIKWNFTKFLVGRDGTVPRRYGSTTTPERIERDLISRGLLARSASVGAGN